tara:strand:- start:848 stop:1021 length:174 start_codon:yes stop_codon:yes gene_type:complete
MTEDEDLIEISEEEIKLNVGGTRLIISGILSRRHAQILALLVLAMVGMNRDVLMGLI